jgi:hypothetical protein
MLTVVACSSCLSSGAEATLDHGPSRLCVLSQPIARLYIVACGRAGAAQAAQAARLRLCLLIPAFGQYCGGTVEIVTPDTWRLARVAGISRLIPGAGCYVSNWASPMSVRINVNCF